MKNRKMNLTLFYLGLFLWTGCNQPQNVFSPEAAEPISSPLLLKAGTQCSQTLSDLVSWWPAEGDAADIIDGNDGIINGVSFISGKVGSAFDFGGALNDVRIPHNANIDFTTADDYTIDFWIKTEPDSTGHAALVEKWNGGLVFPYPYAVRLNTGDTLGASIGPIGTIFCASFDTNFFPFFHSNSRVDDNTFHHVACVFDHPSKRIEIYIDGQLDNFLNYTVALGSISNNLDLLLGIRDSGPVQRPLTDFNGILDEVSIYNRALSAQEIADIFEAGSAGRCMFEIIEIDINTGAINCKNEKRVIKVVMPTTTNFDATNVNHESVRFGKAGTEAVETHANQITGALKRHEEDADGDGDIDLVFHFRFGETGIACGDEDVRITGETFSGQAFEGFAKIKTVGN